MKIKIEATNKQLMAAAQFLKRIGFNGVLPYCENEEEAYNALEALESIRAGLSEQGYNPR